MSSERQPVETTGRWWGEHIHRYHQALQYILPTDRIMDIACGTGFGTSILAENSKGLVVGGDIASEAIAECKARWNKENLEFRVLDGTQLDYPENYFDKIVSFETVEHTTQYREMLSEFARVLKPGGQLILSTPNREVSSPDGIIKNPFHTQEFTFDELKHILASVFSEVEISGQRYKRYDNRSFKSSAGHFFEKMFLGFGIRKLPYHWRSGIMKMLFGYPLYPREQDFLMEKEVNRVKKECPVLFVICRKQGAF